MRAARSCALLVVVAAIGMPTASASADPPLISCTQDFAPGDEVVLDRDLTCERLSWSANSVTIDPSTNTPSRVTQDNPMCGFEESVCDIEMDGGEVSNGRLVGADLLFGTVHDVSITGSTLVEVDGHDNLIENSTLRWGGRHWASILIDTQLREVNTFDKNIMIRSDAHSDNIEQGIQYDITDNWMLDSSISASVYLNAPDDVRGTIARNLIRRGSIDITGVLASMGSMSITDNVIIRSADDAIHVETQDPPAPIPPDLEPGGPLTVARNTIYFSPISIWVNSPFDFGDLSGNRNIISGPCIGIVCSST